MEEWAEIFLATRSPEQEIRDEANQKINQSYETEFSGLLTAIILIIENPEIELTYKLSAITILSTRILRYRRLSQLKELRERFLPIEEFQIVIESLKTVGFNGLTEEHDTMRNMSAFLLAQLIGIHGINIEDRENSEFSQIVQIMKDENAYPCGTIGVLTVIKELFELPNFDLDIRPIFLEFIVPIAEQLIFFLEESEESINAEIKLAASECLILIFDTPTKAPALWNIFTNQEPAMDLLTALPNSFPIVNVQLFYNLHHIMVCLLRINYNNAMEMMETISGYLENSLLTDFPFQMAYFVFWCELADVELPKLNNALIKMEKENNIPQDNRERKRDEIDELEFPSLIREACAQDLIFPHIFAIITSLNPEDYDPFELNMEDFDMMDEANSLELLLTTLQRVYSIAPKECLEFVTDASPDLLSSDDVSSQSAGFLLIDSILHKPHCRWDDIVEFLENALDPIMAALNCEVWRLRSAALITLTDILIEYPKIIYKIHSDDEPLLTISSILEIVSYLPPLSEGDGSIILYSQTISLVQAALNCFEGNKYLGYSTDSNPILNNYTEIKDTINSILSNPNLLISDGYLIEPSFKMLEILIDILQKGPGLPIFIEIYEECVEKVINFTETLQAMRAEHDEGSADHTSDFHVGFYYIGTLFKVIQTIFIKLQGNSQYFNDIDDFLSLLLKYCHSDIAAEAMKTLGALICCFEENFPEEYDDSIAELGIQYLSQQSPELVSGAAHLLGKMFISIGTRNNLLVNHAPELYTETFEALHNYESWFTDSSVFYPILPNLIHIISAIIFSFARASNKGIEFDDSINKFYDPLIEILQNYTDFNFNVTRSEGKKNAQNLIASLAQGFRSLAYLFHKRDSENERTEVELLLNFLKKVKILGYDLFSETVHEILLDTIKVFANNTSNSCSTLMNMPPVRNELNYIIKNPSFKGKKLLENARYLLSDLKKVGKDQYF